MVPDGKLQLVSLDVTIGAGTYGNVDARPPRDYEWEVIEMFGFNDEGGKACCWMYISDSGPQIQKGTNTPATAIRVPLSPMLTGEASTLMAPLRLRNEVWARWTNIDAMTPGKILKVRGLVIERLVGTQ